MEVVKGRGITEGNEVYFDYVDGEVVMTMYRNVPGVRMDRRDPNVIKTFSRDDWDAVCRYLMKTLDKVEGVFVDDFNDKEEVKEAESSPLFQQVVPETSKANGIPKMSNAEAILPENKVPAMTKEEMKENGKEV